MINEQRKSEAYFGWPDEAEVMRLCGTLASIDRDGEIGAICQGVVTLKLHVWLLFCQATPLEALAKIREIH